MYRVELKVVFIILASSSEEKQFLMYRVELKGACWTDLSISEIDRVPNVPCGAESLSKQSFKSHKTLVPNVPCGVESAELKGSKVGVE